MGSRPSVEGNATVVQIVAVTLDGHVKPVAVGAAATLGELHMAVAMAFDRETASMRLVLDGAVLP